MTENELKLLEIAKEAIELNKEIGAKLTGSLMLAVMGINKRREATDIDILCDYLCEKDDGVPIAPIGFKLDGIDGSKSDVEAIQFYNAYDLKIEFMACEEKTLLIGGVKCGELRCMIEAKQRYAKNDLNDISRQKHIDDLDYLYENNPELKN